MAKESSWNDYSIYLPFYLGIFRWCMFICLRVLPSLFYVQIKPIPATKANLESGKYQSVSKQDVTVVVTIYEPPQGFLPAMKQVRKNGPKMVYIIADYTCFHQVKQLLLDNNFDPNQFIVINEQKAGKRAALATGIRLSKTKLTLLMDDDSLWADTFLEEIILPFQFRDIGGVGVKQISEKKSYWNLTDILADMRLSVRYLELRATTFVDRGCSCISGRTGCYLTSLINTDECIDAFLSEKFFGMQTLSGDDKFLTRWVVNNGYKTYHQLYNTCRLTTTFDSGPKLIRQLFRWSRNTWRSDIKNLFVERHIWTRCPFTAFCMFDKILTPFFLLFGPIYVFTLFWIRGFNTPDLVGYAIWLLFSRALRICYHFYENPHHILYLPVFVIFQFVQGFIRVWALFTLKNYAWGTRDVTVGKDGECIRTGKMAYVKEVSYDSDENTVLARPPKSIYRQFNDINRPPMLERPPKSLLRGPFPSVTKYCSSVILKESANFKRSLNRLNTQFRERGIVDDQIETKLLKQYPNNEYLNGEENDYIDFGHFDLIQKQQDQYNQLPDQLNLQPDTSYYQQSEQQPDTSYYQQLFHSGQASNQAPRTAEEDIIIIPDDNGDPFGDPEDPFSKPNKY